MDTASRLQLALKIMFFIILVALISFSVAERVYYVKPSYEDDEFCRNQLSSINTSVCHTLQEYSHSTTDDLTLFFLPGNYTVSQTLNFHVFNLRLSNWQNGKVVLIRTNHPFFRLRATNFTIIHRLNFITILEQKNVSIGASLIVGQGAFEAVNCSFVGGNSGKAIDFYLEYLFEYAPIMQFINITWCSFYDHQVANSCNLLSGCYADNGGAIKINTRPYYVTITNSIFVNNKATNGYGGALAQKYNTLLLTIINCTFINNSAAHGGGAVWLNEGNATLNNCSFESNKVNTSGGAIYYVPSRYDSYNFAVSLFKCNFRGNQAITAGGALFFEPVRYSRTIEIKIFESEFHGNQAAVGGAIYAYANTTRYHNHVGLFSNASDFQNNIAYDGGAVHITESEFHLYSDFFMNNRARNSGGAIYAESSHLVAQRFSVSRNKAGYSGGGIMLALSLIKVTDTVSFQGNSAGESGGGISINSNSSSIFLAYKSQLNLINNSAVGRGGGIFVLDTAKECWRRECFLEFDPQINSSSKPLNFENNSAPEGSDLYGGLLSKCVTNNSKENGLSLFNRFSFYNDSFLAVTSNVTDTCFCVDNIVNCSLREQEVTLARQENLTLSVAGVDQNLTPKQAVIRSRLNESMAAQIDKNESVKFIKNDKCETLVFQVHKTGPLATLVMTADGLCNDSQESSIRVILHLEFCPLGFQQQENKCICDKRILKHLGKYVQCQGNLSLEVSGQIWIGYIGHQLLLQSECPLNYCKGPATRYLDTDDPDKQCAHNRSGILCGKCKANFSIGLGTNKCLLCPNNTKYILIIVIIGILGVGLIILLLLTRLTVSTGTINGLIFYANVVSISGIVNLNSCSIHPILSVFIAWINLDFGIETCFNHNMDAYQKTWLQFVFPLYLCFLVFVVIVISHYSRWVMKLLGRNTIPVLCTLFLLSYTKILKTIIIILTLTEVFEGSADEVEDPLIPYKVWSYDGNVNFLTGKYTALFSVALFFLIIIFLPYTLLLTFGQFLRSMRKFKCLKKILRSIAFISIMDAYHAPFKKKHRYWVGLLLFTRCILFAAFLNSSFESNMLAIILVTFALLVARAPIFNDTYSSYVVNILEIFYFSNLGILAAVMSYLGGKQNPGPATCICITASISIAFLSFACTLVVHIYLYLLSTSKVVLAIKNRFQKEQEQDDVDLVTPPRPADSTPKPHTTTVINVNLREPLLER